MKRFAAIVSVSGLALLGACSTTQTEAPNTSVGEATPTPARISQPANEDISGSSAWFAVERLYPESPEMGLANLANPSSHTYGLSMTCDIDTGRLTGALQFQSGAPGTTATYKLATSEGKVFDLPGGFAANPDTGKSDFVFDIEWMAIKSITESQRADFVDQHRLSQLALVQDDFPQRGDTNLLASLDGFEENQVQLYYYCNPK